MTLDPLPKKILYPSFTQPMIIYRKQVAQYMKHFNLYYNILKFNVTVAALTFIVVNFIWFSNIFF